MRSQRQLHKIWKPEIPGTGSSPWNFKLLGRVYNFFIKTNIMKLIFIYSI